MVPTHANLSCTELTCHDICPKESTVGCGGVWNGRKLGWGQMGRPLKTVFAVSPDAIAEGMPEEFLDCPFVITEDGEAHRQINEYLFARRNGDWAGLEKLSGAHAELSGRRVLKASVLFLSNRVYHLDSIRKWARAESKSLMRLSERQVDQWAEDLEEGLQPGIKDGVLPQTVNQYLTSVIDFFEFCVARRWRRKIGFKYVEIKARGKFEPSRHYFLKRTVNPDEIQFWYSPTDIETFFSELSTSSSVLAAKIMYRTGLRISELLGLTIHSFPTLAEFRKDAAKRHIKVIGKYNKRRKVIIDEDLVRDVQDYIEFERIFYKNRLTKRSDALILGHKPNGRSGPMTARYLQKDFQRARLLSHKSELTPHKLRHHYACHYLLRSWTAKASMMGIPAVLFDREQANSMLSGELIYLKKQLGHSNIDTTIKYLDGVSELLDLGIQNKFSEGLDPT